MSDGFARGIFGARAGVGAPPRRAREQTLTELRWHHELPASGEEAERVSRAISESVLLQLRPLPDAEWRRAEQVAAWRDSTAANGAPRKTFVNTTTGMRLHYLRWGAAAEPGAPQQLPTVLLLHGLGDCAGVLAGLAASLAGRGCVVLAPDLRGHGDSSPSADGNYTAAALAADLLSFIIELDLYTAPLLLVGLGAGAAAAAALAAAQPALVGGVVLCELWDQGPADALSFAYGQAATFATEAEAAAFACADCWGHAPRPLPPVARHNSWRLRRAEGGGVRMRVDPRMLFRHSGEDVLRNLGQVTCHVQLLHGARSHVGGAADAAGRPAERAARLAAAASRAASCAVTALPKAGHYVLEDAPLELRDAVLRCARAWAPALLPTAAGKAERTPESLGLRALPQFATLADAQRALAPRRIPDAAAIAEALAAARAGDEAPSDDDDSDGEGGGRARRATALAKEPLEYFGFVG